MMLSSGALASTLAGGAVALRARERLPFALAFTTGMILGVVVFDLLPELEALASRDSTVRAASLAALVLAFLSARSAEALLRTRGDASQELRPHVGTLSASALISHSAFDGVGIGLAFQVSTGMGISVAVAVIAHDFADGINTVAMMLVHGHDRRRASYMLVLDALAPLGGVLSTRLVRLPPMALSLCLGVFTGVLLHVATSSTHTAATSPSRRAVAGAAATSVAGALFAFAVAYVSH